MVLLDLYTVAAVLVGRTESNLFISLFRLIWVLLLIESVHAIAVSGPWTHLAKTGVVLAVIAALGFLFMVLFDRLRLRFKGGVGVAIDACFETTNMVTLGAGVIGFYVLIVGCIQVFLASI